jgi:hypothetical protein
LVSDTRRDQNSWFSPPKIAETESSAKTFMIVSARSGATVGQPTCA